MKKNISRVTMQKKISDVQAIIDTSPKYKDCLLLPIGITDGKCNDLSLSCRGKMPNTNGYIISGGLFEIENFLKGLLLNSCKKYNSNELKISYYNFATNVIRIPFLNELPNIKIVKTLVDYEEFKEEFQLLKNETNERLNKIFQYEGCYARAIHCENNNLIANMPQELLIIHASGFDLSNSSPKSQEIHHYLSQELWRAGIYPLIVLEHEEHFPNDFYYGGRLWLSFRYDGPVKLEPLQSYMHIAEDSWCLGSERKEVVEIPYYTEDWVKESIEQIIDING